MMKVWTEVTFAGRARGASAEADKVVLPELSHHYRRYLSNNNALCYSGFVWFSISMLDLIIKNFLKLCACVFVLIKMNCFKKEVKWISHTEEIFWQDVLSVHQHWVFLSGLIWNVFLLSSLFCPKSQMLKNWLLHKKESIIFNLTSQP